MPHTSAGPIQLAVVALFAKKERRNMSLRQIKTRDLCFTPSWLDSSQIESPLPSPPELNPPRATNLFLLLKSPSSFRRSSQLSRASSPLFPNIYFRLGMGEREGVLGNLGKSFRRQSDAQTLPPPPPSFALCVCVIRKKPLALAMRGGCCQKAPFGWGGGGIGRMDSAKATRRREKDFFIIGGT